MNFFNIFRTTFPFPFELISKMLNGKWSSFSLFHTQGVTALESLFLLFPRIFVSFVMYLMENFVFYSVFPPFSCICNVCLVLNGKPHWFVGYLCADVVGSAVGFTVFATLLCSWALTFSIGGERLFGPVWDQLVMYNLADRFGLTGWS